VELVPPRFFLAGTGVVSFTRVADRTNGVGATCDRSQGRVFRLLGFAMRVHRQASNGIISDFPRKAFSFLGILLLSALALSMGARRPYLQRASPPAHTLEASTMTAARLEVVPLAQPARASKYPDEPPRSNPSFPVQEVILRNPPGIFCVHALRSPPII
jgi:hypothetical protein